MRNALLNKTQDDSIDGKRAEYISSDKYDRAASTIVEAQIAT